MAPTQGDRTGGVARDIAEAVEAFEEEHPHLAKELDVVGMEVDEYVRVLAANEPQITTSNSTA